MGKAASRRIAQTNRFSVGRLLYLLHARVHLWRPYELRLARVFISCARTDRNRNPTQVDSTCRASAARKHAYTQAHKPFAENKEAHKHTYIRASPQSTAHSASKSARGATFPPPQMLCLVQLIGIQQCCYSSMNSTQTSSVFLG